MNKRIAILAASTLIVPEIISSLNKAIENHGKVVGVTKREPDPLFIDVEVDKAGEELLEKPYLYAWGAPITIYRKVEIETSYSSTIKEFKQAWVVTHGTYAPEDLVKGDDSYVTQLANLPKTTDRLTSLYDRGIPVKEAAAIVEWIEKSTQATPTAAGSPIVKASNQKEISKLAEDSITDKKDIMMSYNSKGKQENSMRRISPIKLEKSDEGGYLVEAFDHKTKTVRKFLTKHILSAILVDKVVAVV